MQDCRVKESAKGGIHCSYGRYYDALAWEFQPTRGDPMIVFLISASILALVTVTLISGFGGTQGRRA
jgi:hypothetical protein